MRSRMKRHARLKPTSRRTLVQCFGSVARIWPSRRSIRGAQSLFLAPKKKRRSSRRTPAPAEARLVLTRARKDQLHDRRKRRSGACVGRSLERRVPTLVGAIERGRSCPARDHSPSDAIRQLTAQLFHFDKNPGCCPHQLVGGGAKAIHGLGRRVHLRISERLFK